MWRISLDFTKQCCDFSLKKYMGEIVSEKFFIKHDNIALLVNTMAGRLSEWSGCLSEIMMNFDDFSSSEGFTGNSANAAREYCATYYGCNGASSLPILLSESAVAISEALLLYEKTFLDFDTVEKFSISEEEIDYIIQDAEVEAIGDFETIHENAINIINSISDIVELPKPDDTYYIQDSEDIVSQLEEVKEDIYELEAAELVIIEELTEQIDSLLTLVEAYSNKEKRASTFVNTDEIITTELEAAIEEYAKSCQRRQLNAVYMDEAKAQHAATMERIQKEFEEQRKKQGEQKIWHGIFAATVGTLCIVCTAGAASPVVIGAGLTFGAGSLLYGDSYIQEGEEDIYYASIGDVSTPASNYIRDSSVFKGNQELYDLWGSINVSGAASMIPVGLKGSGVLKSSVNMTSSSLATETRFVVYDTIASESASFGMGEYCDYKGIDGTDKLMLQSAASFVTSLGMVKASNISQGTKQVTKFSYDDLPGEEAVFRLDDVNLTKLETIDSNPMGYYDPKTLIDNKVTRIKQQALPSFVSESFKDGKYVTVVTNEDIYVYRCFGFNSDAGGAFATSVAITDRIAAKEQLAILPEWKNSLKYRAKILIPEGTTLNIGKVAEQTTMSGCILKGNVDQILLPENWDLNWIKEITLMN